MTRRARRRTRVAVNRAVRKCAVSYGGNAASTRASVRKLPLSSQREWAWCWRG